MSREEYVSHAGLKNVTDIRNAFAAVAREHTMLCLDEPECTNDCMLELIGATFIVNDDHIFGEVNDDYVARELEWYESMSLNVNDIPGGPPWIWKKVAVPDGETELGHLRPGTINSNYGFLLYHRENGAQYASVAKALARDPFTRQAVAVYTRPSIHRDATRDGMHDFICTNTVQYLYRGGCLHAVVNMRSNDAIFGFRNDLAWQRHVLHQLVEDLKEDFDVEVGNIIWQVGSLHIYPRHHHLVRRYIDEGVHDGKL